VVLGAVIAGEAITTTSLLGGAITVLAVFVVVSEEGARRRRAPLPEPPEVYEPDDLQGRLRSSAT
jgi:hypothetical protein